jgi:hypothetical protein
MTRQEHELMILMFSRVNESIGIIVETLTSRGIWSDDDPKAFSHAVHADDQKLLFYAAQARKDYSVLAKQAGITVSGI